MDYKKTVTIRELQQNLYACIKELPILVTKNGKDHMEIRNVATKDINVATSPRVVKEKKQVSPPLGGEAKPTASKVGNVATPPPSVVKEGTPKNKSPKISKKKLLPIGTLCKHHLTMHEGCHV